MSRDYKRGWVSGLLRLRGGDITELMVDNGVWLADHGYSINPVTGDWRRQVRGVFVVVGQNLLETMSQHDFSQFTSKQEFIALSGRVPGEKGLVMSNGN